MERSDSRKRSRFARDNEDETTTSQQHSVMTDIIEPRLFSLQFPAEFELEFAATIFDLGLKHASPKILMPLMPQDAALNTEHIKSHLQKYRIHKQRSKEEFQAFYEKYIKEHFHLWEARNCWEQVLPSVNPSSVVGLQNVQLSSLSPSSSSSNIKSTKEDIKNLGISNTTNDSGRQEQLQKKMRQMVEMEEILAQSSEFLQRWKEIGSQLFQQSLEAQHDVAAAISCLEPISK